MTQLRSVVLEVTNRCNLRCIHCGSTSGRARPDEMSLDEMLALVDDLASLGCEVVTLLGGEVFLHKGWEQIARRIRDREMGLIVVTNGLLVTEEISGRLATLEPWVVGVSIDGATPASYEFLRGSDGFDRSMHALTLLREAGVDKVTAITCFHRENLKDFDPFADLFAGTGFTWQVQIAGKGGDRFPGDLFLTLEDYRTLVDKVIEAKDQRKDLKLVTMDDIGYFPLTEGPPSLETWTGCEAGVSVLGIRANGDILPCLSLADDFIIDSIRRRPLADIWADDHLFDRFRNKVSHLSGTCAACDKKVECRGGCTEMAYSATGSIGENPYCIRALERARLLSLIGH